MDEPRFDRDVMEARLDNWGRWCRSKTRSSQSSPLYGILVRMGYCQENAQAESKFSEFDSKDAELLDRVISRIPCCPEKDWLVERFVWRRTGERALRGVRFALRKFYRDRAMRMVFSGSIHLTFGRR